LQAWIHLINFPRYIPLGKNINTVNANGIFAINTEGSEIIVTNDYLGNKTAPIARSKKTNGIWAKPEPVFIEDYYNKSPYVDFYLSYPHKVLFVAAERKGGAGDQDIYVCFEGENGNWKTLFFASTREGGQGGSDIYAATRLDDSWTNWSEPKNLGPAINTDGDENYFSMTADLKTLFVETLTKEKTKRSIYKIEMSSFNELASQFLLSSK
jgi:hypothetical protein